MADIVFAIDASSNYRPFWSTVLKQTKAILRGLEHIEGVSFGMGDQKSRIVVNQYPLSDGNPSLGFEDYNNGMLKTKLAKMVRYESIVFRTNGWIIVTRY